MPSTIIPLTPRSAGAPIPAARAAVPAVRAAGLTKTYRHPWTLQTVTGLAGLDLDVRAGEVFGYLGPNGAGKTTTLKLLTGLHRPSSGDAWIFGDSIRSDAARRHLGFLPEQPYFYDYLTGIEYLELAGRLSGLQGAEAGAAARHWLGRVGLGDKPRLLLRKYSKGMLQRLGLAAALVHAPKLLILDEPMSGLDPFGRRDVRDLILEQREQGTTVLFSSHILPDVEMISDRIGILLRGRLTRVATVGELVAAHEHRMEIRCTGVSTHLLPPAFEPVIERREHAHETMFVLTDVSKTGAFLQWLIGQGIEVRAMTPYRPTLEELFMEAAGAEHIGTRAGSSEASS